MAHGQHRHAQVTKTILGAIFSGFLNDFSVDFRSLCKPIVEASVEAYTRISVSGIE
jgi:hypothetical protein